jgi:hypothetical protein
MKANINEAVSISCHAPTVRRSTPDKPEGLSTRDIKNISFFIATELNSVALVRERTIHYHKLSLCITPPRHWALVWPYRSNYGHSTRCQERRTLGHLREFLYLPWLSLRQLNRWKNYSWDKQDFWYSSTLWGRQMAPTIAQSFHYIDYGSATWIFR